MKSKLKMLCAVMFFTCVVFAGCSINSNDSKVTSTEISTESTEESASSIWRGVALISYDDMDSYEFTGSALFLPVSYETVDNGDYNKTVFTEFVYVPDGTLWMESYKTLTIHYKGGLGQSLVQIIGTDGKPKVYDGDIDELREKYGVKYKEEEEK